MAGRDGVRSISACRHRERAALAARGIDTEPWFERQLARCILGAMLQPSWEKALGDDAELEWWSGVDRRGRSTPALPVGAASGASSYR